MNKKGENMNKKGENKEEKIDWNSLDKGWAEDYKETYGHLFGDIIVKSEYP